jgi:hypothetical protein
MADEVTSNLAAVQVAIEELTARLDYGLYQATTAIALALKNQAVENVSQNRHRIGEPRVDSPFPNTVTGNLRNNIMAVPASRIGFGTYVAEVNSGAAYSMALETGSSKWKSGVSYPYMTPARDEIILSGKAEQYVISAVNVAIRG